MKKLLALVLALVMLCSVASASDAFVYTIGFAPITQEELGMNILFSVQPLPAN